MDKIKEPKLRILETKSIEECIEEEIYSNLKITFNGNQNLKLDEITFNNCEIYKVDFTKIDFNNICFVDCVLNECDFSNLLFDHMYLKRCVFDDCKMVGTNFINCSLNDVKFNNSNLKYANICETKFNNVLLKNINLIDSRFIDCATKNFIVEHCDFTRGEIINCELQNVNFNDSNISEISIDLKSLKGIIVNQFQAVMLAHLLGVVVQD